MKKSLFLSLAALLGLSLPFVASAQFTVSATIGGVPSISNPVKETFNSVSPSILTLSGSASLVTGDVFGYSVRPYYSGTTAAYFGDSPATGPDASQYVAVDPGGSATLTFAIPQTYLGILWGSVDSYDVLSFYDSANHLIGTVTGSTVTASNPSITQTSDATGTAYVNITSTTAFTKVVATASDIAFEFDNVTYVPEPASGVLLLAGISVLALRKLRK